MRVCVVVCLLLAGCGPTAPAQRIAQAPAVEPARAPVPAPPPKVVTSVPAPPVQAAPPPKLAPSPKDGPTRKPAPTPKAAQPPRDAPTPKAAPPPRDATQPRAATLDLNSLEQRLKETSAIGVLTKLSLKNQVDDLVARFRAFHGGQRPPTLGELRPSFDLLLMKVLSLLQDKDAALAKDIDASRNAIWEVLTDRDKLAKIS